MIVALLWACATSETAPAPVVAPADAGPVDGDVLVVALPGDPGNISPLVAPYATSAMIGELVTPGLVRRTITDQGLIYEPNLAESAVWSPTGDAITYTLRDGLRWSDGSPLTSADVAFTWSLLADPVVASNWLGQADKVSAVETPDPRTVIYRFPRPQNPLLQQGYTIRGVVSAASMGRVDRGALRGSPLSRQPVASGPFVVSEWSLDEKIVLVANPQAPEAWRPHLSRVVLRVLPEASTRRMELLAGNVDYVLEIDPTDVPAIVADPRLRLLVEPAAGMQYVGYKLSDPRFADREVRWALTAALDREGLVRELFTVQGQVHAQPCTGTVAPTLGPWFNADIDPVPFDLAGAKAALDAAGWVDPDGDGVRAKGGTPLRFSLMLQSGQPLNEQIAVRAQAAWKAIGAQVDIDRVEPLRFAERARQKDFDAMLWSFGANPKVDPSMEWRTGGAYNWFGYSNPVVDAKIDEGVAATDVGVAQAAFRDVQRLVHDDQPVTFLFWEDAFGAIDRRFQGTEQDTFTRLRHLERWWVPAAAQRYRR